MTPEEYRLLRELFNETAGLSFSDDLMHTVARRLSDRLTALRLGSFREYYHYLRYHPRREVEFERVMDLLTTNETYLFRELIQLRAFKEQVLPELRREAEVRRSLTLWSAGCSSGEEVYTLAILVHESGLFRDWDVRIFGNDISRRVLQMARSGIFRESSFRALPPEYEGYFVLTPEGRTVLPHIRTMCSFAHFNLFDTARIAMVGHVDAIFCRNVLIYFDKESRRRLIQSFYERLHPGGFLMLGHSESLLHASTAFELAHLRGDLAYRKPLSGDDKASTGGGR